LPQRRRVEILERRTNARSVDGVNRWPLAIDLAPIQKFRQRRLGDPVTLAACADGDDIPFTFIGECINVAEAATQEFGYLGHGLLGISFVAVHIDLSLQKVLKIRFHRHHAANAAPNDVACFPYPTKDYNAEVKGVVNLFPYLAAQLIAGAVWRNANDNVTPVASSPIPLGKPSRTNTPAIPHCRRKPFTRCRQA
jgi:hypothetical protein